MLVVANPGQMLAIELTEANLDLLLRGVYMVCPKDERVRAPVRDILDLDQADVADKTFKGVWWSRHRNSCYCTYYDSDLLRSRRKYFHPKGSDVPGMAQAHRRQAAEECKEWLTDHQHGRDAGGDEEPNVESSDAESFEKVSASESGLGSAVRPSSPATDSVTGDGEQPVAAVLGDEASPPSS